MRKEELFDAVGAIDPEWIEEARPAKKRNPAFYWIPAASVTACLLLALIAVPLAGKLQNVDRGGPAAPLTADTRGDEPIITDTFPRDDNSTKSVPESDPQASFFNIPTNTAFKASIGGIYISMSGEEVRALWGDPADTHYESDVKSLEEGAHACWFYQKGDGKITLEMVYQEKEWQVYGVIAYQSTLPLEPLHISAGTPAATVETAFLEAFGDRMERSSTGEGNEDFSVEFGGLILRASLEKGKVVSVALETIVWYGPDEPLANEPNAADPYLNWIANDVTVYGNGKTVHLTGKDAKLLCTALTIEDLREGKVEGEPAYILLFDGKAAIAFTGVGDMGFSYKVTDYEAFTRAAAEGRIEGAELLAQGKFPEGAYATLLKLLA